MIAYLELGYLTPLSGLRVCYTDLNIPWYSYTCVYEHTKRAHKYKYVQIILVLLHPDQQDCVDGVTNSLHIMEHLAIHNKLNHSHLSTRYHHLYKYSGDVITSMCMQIVTSCCQ